MSKNSNELAEMSKDIEKIKVFCSYVAEEHDHVPHLKKVWNQAAGTFVYAANTRYDDLSVLKSSIMKALLELEERVEDLEKLNY